MIADHDVVHAIAKADRLYSGHQLANRSVDPCHRVADLVGIRTPAMSGTVDIRKVERQKGRPFGFGKPQPVEHAFDALAVWHVVIKRRPERRLASANHRFRPGPEHRRGFPALPLRGVPDRFAAPPARIGEHVPIAHAELAWNVRRPHVVRDDAVVRRRQAGDDAVVVWKGLGRKLRNQAIGAHALRRQALQRRRLEPVEVVPAEAIDRDQDQDGLFRRGDRCWTARDQRANERGREQRPAGQSHLKPAAAHSFAGSSARPLAITSRN